jgi:hypothetical protein
MPAYFVYACQEVLDRAKLETYWREIVPTLEGYGAKSSVGRCGSPCRKLTWQREPVVIDPLMGWSEPGQLPKRWLPQLWYHRPGRLKTCRVRSCGQAASEQSNSPRRQG